MLRRDEGSTPFWGYRSFNSLPFVTTQPDPAFGLTVIQSIPGGIGKCPVCLDGDLPAVSMEFPDELRVRLERRLAPVITAKRVASSGFRKAGRPALAETISEALSYSPPPGPSVPVKSVSQNGHERLQPENLTNTAGLPVFIPSP